MAWYQYVYTPLHSILRSHKLYLASDCLLVFFPSSVASTTSLGRPLRVVIVNDHIEDLPRIPTIPLAFAW